MIGVGRNADTGVFSQGLLGTLRICRSVKFDSIVVGSDILVMQRFAGQLVRIRNGDE
jgi:hypothetical protein